MEINQNNTFGPNTVNIGPQQRHFVKESDKNVLRNHLDKNKKINVFSVLGDTETFNFASEILAFLKSDGYNVGNEVNQGTFFPPPEPQSVNDRPDGSIDVVIGSQKNY